MRKGLRSAATASLALGALCAGLLVGQPAPQVTADEDASPSAPVSEQLPERFLILTGSLRAADAERFHVPITDTWNVQLKWLVEEGAQVAADDAIARFDTAGVEDALFDAENDLEQKVQQRGIQESEGMLQRLDLELALKRSEVEYRKTKLDAAIPQDMLDGQGYRQRQRDLATKRKEFDDAQLALSAQGTILRAALSGFDIEISQLKRRIRESEEQLASLTINATKPGIVVHEEHRWFGRKVRVGDQLQATFPVASIPDLSSLEVESWVSEADAWRLEVDQTSRIALDAYPNRRLTGRVSSIGRAGESRPQWGKEKYFRVIVTLDRIDETVMKPGMSVRAVVDLSRPADETRVVAQGADVAGEEAAR